MKTFTTKREIRTTPATIFAAFADPELLAKWWGPAGFTNTFSEFEFKEGGKWVFVMHGPDGTNYHNESEFAEIIPEQKIVIRHIVQPVFTLTILISSIENGSLVEWIQEFESAEIAEKIDHIVIPSNEQNLDRLTAVLSE